MKVGSGAPGPGRPKGSASKTTRALKDAILNAFENVGGGSYLEQVAKTDPRTFCTLLGKVLPMTVAGDPDNPITRIQRIEVVYVQPSNVIEHEHQRIEG
jgi:hypothetical protein